MCPHRLCRCRLYIHKICSACGKRLKPFYWTYVQFPFLKEKLALYTNSYTTYILLYNLIIATANLMIKSINTHSPFFFFLLLQCYCTVIVYHFFKYTILYCLFFLFVVDTRYRKVTESVKLFST